LTEGTPTGIKRQDLNGRQGVTYRGERAQVVRSRETYKEIGSEAALLLGYGDRHLMLHGYFEGDEFMMHREEPVQL
jgi:hypothetical protein